MKHLVMKLSVRGSINISGKVVIASRLGFLQHMQSCYLHFLKGEFAGTANVYEHKYRPFFLYERIQTPFL